MCGLREVSFATPDSEKKLPLPGLTSFLGQFGPCLLICSRPLSNFAAAFLFHRNDCLGGQFVRYAAAGAC